MKERFINPKSTFQRVPMYTSEAYDVRYGLSTNDEEETFHTYRPTHWTFETKRASTIRLASRGQSINLQQFLQNPSNYVDNIFDIGLMEQLVLVRYQVVCVPISSIFHVCLYTSNSSKFQDSSTSNFSKFQDSSTNNNQRTHDIIVLATPQEITVSNQNTMGCLEYRDFDNDIPIGTDFCKKCSIIIQIPPPESKRRIFVTITFYHLLISHEPSTTDIKVPFYHYNYSFVLVD